MDRVNICDSFVFDQLCHVTMRLDVLLLWLKSLKNELGDVPVLVQDVDGERLAISRIDVCESDEGFVIVLSL